MSSTGYAARRKTNSKRFFKLGHNNPIKRAGLSGSHLGTLRPFRAFRISGKVEYQNPLQKPPAPSIVQLSLSSTVNPVLGERHATARSFP